jgi:uncharacterized membrane protein
MRVDVVSDIEIGRPLDQVAAFAGDPTNAPRWSTNIKSVEWLTEPPVAVGSKLDFVADFLGRRLAYTYEIVECVPNERLVMSTLAGPFPMETTYAWQALDAGRTRMTLRNRGEPSGFSRLLAPVLGLTVRRANRQDLRRLKRILEAG